MALRSAGFIPSQAASFPATSTGLLINEQISKRKVDLKLRLSTCPLTVVIPSAISDRQRAVSSYPPASSAVNLTLGFFRGDDALAYWLKTGSGDLTDRLTDSTPSG